MNNPCVSWPLNSRLTFGGGNPETSRESSSCHSDLAKDSNPPRFKAHIIYYEIHCCMNYHQKTYSMCKAYSETKKGMWTNGISIVFHIKYQFPWYPLPSPRHRPLPTHPLGAPFELTSMVCIRLSRVFMPCSTCQVVSWWHQKASSNRSEECHTLRSTNMAGWKTTMV